MKKQIYNTLADTLADLADIAHVGLWNNQLQYIAEEQPFDTPAVFIEFEPTQWSELLHGVREAVVTVRLHVVTDSRVGRWADIVDVFDLHERINAALHAVHRIETDGSVIDSLALAADATDHNFDELRDDTLDYRCHVTDRSGYAR